MACTNINVLITRPRTSPAAGLAPASLVLTRGGNVKGLSMSYRESYTALILTGLFFLVLAGAIILFLRPALEFVFNSADHCSVKDLYYLKCGGGRVIAGVVIGYFFLAVGIVLFLIEKSLTLLKR